MTNRYTYCFPAIVLYYNIIIFTSIRHDNDTQ